MLLIHKHTGDWRARTFLYYQHLSKDQNAKYGTVRMASINYQSKIRYDKIACFKVKLNWTRGSFFVFAP